VRGPDPVRGAGRRPAWTVSGDGTRGVAAGLGHGRPGPVARVPSAR
jgi:hypothetical protein